MRGSIGVWERSDMGGSFAAELGRAAEEHGWGGVGKGDAAKLDKRRNGKYAYVSTNTLETRIAAEPINL